MCNLKFCPLSKPHKYSEKHICCGSLTLPLKDICLEDASYGGKWTEQRHRLLTYTKFVADTQIFM